MDMTIRWVKKTETYSEVYCYTLGCSVRKMKDRLFKANCGSKTKCFRTEQAARKHAEEYILAKAQRKSSDDYASKF